MRPRLRVTGPSPRSHRVGTRPAVQVIPSPDYPDHRVDAQHLGLIKFQEPKLRLVSYRYRHVDQMIDVHLEHLGLSRKVSYHSYPDKIPRHSGCPPPRSRRLSPCGRSTSGPPPLSQDMIDIQSSSSESLRPRKHQIMCGGFLVSGPHQLPWPDTNLIIDESV